VPFGFGWMAGGAGLSSQYWSDLVTRGVRADRVGAKLRHPLSSGWCEAPDGESRPASGPKNLGWHRAEALRSSRKVRNGADVSVSPGAGGRCGGRGPNPFRSLSPSPAQAGRAASDVRLGIGWFCGCACGLFWLQKSTSGVGSGCTFAASRKLANNPPGPGHPALCTGGERTPEAGSSVETSWPR